MEQYSTLIARIKSREAVIGIVGMGYVGQPLALRYVEVGFNVIGFDIDAEKVAELNSGKSAIEHINDSVIASAVSNGLSVTYDFSRIADVDAIILCVPTPLNKYR